MRERAREDDRPLQPFDGPALRAGTESGWQSAAPMARQRPRHRLRLTYAAKNTAQLVRYKLMHLQMTMTETRTTPTRRQVQPRVRPLPPYLPGLHGTGLVPPCHFHHGKTLIELLSLESVTPSRIDAMPENLSKCTLDRAGFPETKGLLKQSVLYLLILGAQRTQDLNRFMCREDNRKSSRVAETVCLPEPV
jgi:hypothetical protein